MSAGSAEAPPQPWQYRNDGGASGSENSPPQDSFDLAADRSLAYFNAKFRWVTTGVLDLPFGKGHHLLGHGPAAAALGGWQVSGILQLQSAFPFTIDYQGDPINIGGGSGGILVRPSYALSASGSPIDPNLPGNQRSTSEWFNTSAFVQPIYAFGNVGRNTVLGAPLYNLDATIARTFHPVEKAWVASCPRARSNSGSRSGFRTVHFCTKVHNAVGQPVATQFSRCRTSAQMVGRTPWSAAGPLAGLPEVANAWLFRRRAGPGGPARTRGTAPPFMQNPAPCETRSHRLANPPRTRWVRKNAQKCTPIDVDRS